MQQQPAATETQQPVYLRRLPYANKAYAPSFVLNGANKRRQMAYQRAYALQREMGVIPFLRCVK